MQTTHKRVLGWLIYMITLTISFPTSRLVKFNYAFLEFLSMQRHNYLLNWYPLVGILFSISAALPGGREALRLPSVIPCGCPWPTLPGRQYRCISDILVAPSSLHCLLPHAPLGCLTPTVTWRGVYNYLQKGLGGILWGTNIIP